MTPREQLLAALVLQPEDRTAWLALADCLEEEGEHQRGELTREIAQMHQLGPGSKRRAAESRVVALLAQGVRPCVPEFTNSVGMRLAFIPPGRFRMGSPVRGEPRRMDDEALHTVRLTRGYWMGVFSVTQAHYRAVMRRSPSDFSARRLKDASVSADLLPVESVSWQDATDFCERLSARRQELAVGRVYRLPTEAEWEYACRAGLPSRFIFHHGPELTASHATFNCRYPYPPVGEVSDNLSPFHPSEVGSHAPNAFGLFDMHGNVDEWCQDWYGADYYEESPEIDPAGPIEGSYRIIRGGSWQGQGEDARAAVRIGYDPQTRVNYVGFRVVCEIEA